MPVCNEKYGWVIPSSIFVGDPLPIVILNLKPSTSFFVTIIATKTHPTTDVRIRSHNPNKESSFFVQIAASKVENAVKERHNTTWGHLAAQYRVTFKSSKF
jgi:hypothetical protein